MSAILKRLAAMLAAIGAILFLSAAGQAQSWTPHQFGEVSFQAPPNWAPTSRRGDRAIVLADPSGRELRVEWWLADEPFLGFSDIIAHKRITIGGKRATWRHSSFPNMQSVAALLDEKRKDRRQLLIVLEVPGREAATAVRLFDDILARFSFGVPAQGGTQLHRGWLPPSQRPPPRKSRRSPPRCGTSPCSSAAGAKRSILPPGTTPRSPRSARASRRVSNGRCSAATGPCRCSVSISTMIRREAPAISSCRFTTTFCG